MAVDGDKAPDRGNSDGTDDAGIVGLSRRELLGSAAVTGLAAVLSGRGRAQQADRRNVGLGADADEDVATDRAQEVFHVLDFESIGKAVAGRFTESAIEELEGREDVRYTEGEAEARVAGRPTLSQVTSEQTPWGIDRIEADQAHENGTTGSDSIDVAIVDTGIVSDHEDLETNIGDGHAVVECTERDNRSDCRYGQSNENPRTEPWDDDYDHGTHVAGSVGAVANQQGVLGVSPDVTLHAVKVLDECGFGFASDIAAGVTHAVDEGWDLINMSLGGPESEILRDACEYADRNDLLVVAAAGNDGSDQVQSPAAYSEVVATTATNDDDSLYVRSNRGPSTEVTAPGVRILSTVYDDYAKFTGTSMAAPHATGVLALLRANGYAAEEARDRLRGRAEDIGLDEEKQGNGLVNAANALDLDDGPPNTLRITKEEAEDGVANYEVTVSGDIEATDSFESGGTDSINGNTASGRVGPEAGSDAINYSGEITEFSLDGPAIVYRNGEEVDPDDLPDDGDDGDGSDLPNTLNVTKEEVEDGVANYEVTVSGDIEATDSFESGGTDSINGNTASGRVGPEAGSDAINYSGEITEFSLDGPAIVYRNGEEVDPDDLGDDGTDDLPNRLEVTKEGADDGEAEFEVTVSGDIEATDSLEDGGRDSVDGNTATGVVGPEGGTDAVRYSGEITDFSLEGPARVFRNGEEVDPENLG